MECTCAFCISANSQFLIGYLFTIFSFLSALHRLHSSMRSSSWSEALVSFQTSQCVWVWAEVNCYPQEVQIVEVFHCVASLAAYSALVNLLHGSDIICGCLLKRSTSQDELYLKVLSSVYSSFTEEQELTAVCGKFQGPLQPRGFTVHLRAA